ncbi:hypothetical protein BDM02DRAFT_471820 [Thelephora ganbajun]|uniref:Uncharacterized protein n=1 Tax=Thelephora ganbajun TaxID=370292 RepID=A0ACB6Z836_THEGA|nr:hypothetical protein BDM02DRAFT_471820 [Thelephora ganbajun]
MAATIALREALNQGISSGNLVDTKIILYSHRSSSGRIYRPKALYANSHVLKTVPYFSDLLFGNFAESQSKDFKEPIDEEESAEDYGYSSDSDLEDDGGEKSPLFKHKTKPKVHPFNPFTIPGEDKIVCEEHDEHPEKGKVVKIPDTAFVTFQAFLMYLYTNMIEFAPFGSKQNRRLRSADFVTPSDDKVPRPSPKSIYRLADKYDFPALKTLALNHIRGELEKCDIVEESSSRFASRYDEIRNLCIEQLAFVLMEDSTETTRASVDKKIDNFVEGDLEHASEMLSVLWEIANKDGDITAPSKTVPAAAQVTSPAHWGSVKVALIKSIRKGVFFDRKYWARHSKAGDILKPVYFSSIIMNDKAQQLNKLVKYLKGRNPLMHNLEGDVNVESDCEGDSPEVKNDLKTEEKEDQTRAVLVTGSFSAWKSLFFYRCTDTILYAPLKSQGIDSRLNHIHGNTVAAAPPPCSPKSIYVLASLLETQPLCDSAFKDIKNKVCLDNVVDEVLSWVTAGQEKIMEMQCELLISNFKGPKTVALMKENIGRISDGSSSHCGGALKRGLKKAFGLKEKKRQSSDESGSKTVDKTQDLAGVLLRCCNCNCRWHKNPVPCSYVVSITHCQICMCYIICAGCGHQRTSNCASCQSCGKTFI